MTVKHNADRNALALKEDKDRAARAAKEDKDRVHQLELKRMELAKSTADNERRNSLTKLLADNCKELIDGSPTDYANIIRAALRDNKIDALDVVALANDIENTPSSVGDESTSVKTTKSL